MQPRLVRSNGCSVQPSPHKQQGQRTQELRLVANHCFELTQRCRQQYQLPDLRTGQFLSIGVWPMVSGSSVDISAAKFKHRNAVFDAVVG